MASTNSSNEPRSALEVWREIAQLHLAIGSALRELDELMVEWFAAQRLGDDGKEEGE